MRSLFSAAGIPRRSPVVLTAAAALLLSSGALAQTAGAAPQADGKPAPYIVVLKETAATAAAGSVASDQAQRLGFDVGHVYRHALRGYSADLTPAQLQAVRTDGRVAFVERDQQVGLPRPAAVPAASPTDVRPAVQTVPTGVRRVFADDNPYLKINGVDDFRVDVDVAVIDTGIDGSHPDLNIAGRTDCNNASSCTDGVGNDGNGHGTHVAGTIGAIDDANGVVGVAPGARVWSVKVLNDSGSGSYSGVVAGIDWVTARAGQIEVANMSLGGPHSDALNTALRNSVDAGVVHVVAAGNDAKDAQGTSPADSPDVVTVSALADFNGEPGGGASSTCRSDADDTLAAFSNHGRLVEITAPGVCINSTWKGGGYNTISGTSMASPHAAGAAAVLASAANDPKSRADVERIRQTLVDTGNQNWRDDSGDGIQEPLLDTKSLSSTPPDPGAPSARFTHSCTDATLACSLDATSSSDPDGTLTGYAWDFGDGTTGTGATASHTYARNGTYTVKLTVTDNSGKTSSTSRAITVGRDPALPVASFTHTCTGLSCTFDASSSSDNGRITQYKWTSSGWTLYTTKTTAQRTFRSAGTYTVTLTVTDNDGNTDSTAKSVTVR